jgi:CBS domain containing-hemolysin-like protein
MLIPETMAANVMLNKMIKEQSNMAVVLDEFGGTSGIITMEDLMEEIFGEIEDEFDKDKLVEKEIDKNTVLLSGRIEIDYLNEVYKLELEKSEEYETIGGYITHFFENIPEEGTLLTIKNHSFEIVQAGNTKIDLVKLHINK